MSKPLPPLFGGLEDIESARRTLRVQLGEVAQHLRWLSQAPEGQRWSDVHRQLFEEQRSKWADAQKKIFEDWAFEWRVNHGVDTEVIATEELAKASTAVKEFFGAQR